jgi:tRNA threonylcarbamoyladenosine biosynthesis protein TsaB
MDSSQGLEILQPLFIDRSGASAGSGEAIIAVVKPGMSPNVPPFTLAIESSTTTCDVALFRDGGFVRNIETSRGMRCASLMTQNIADLLQDAGIGPRDLSLIGVSIGPGSFTGLRIGCVVAKTLAYALAIDLVAVPTHKAIARRYLESLLPKSAPTSNDGSSLIGGIHVVTDGQRRQLFTSSWSQSSDALLPGDSVTTSITEAATFSAVVDANDRVTGAGIRLLRPTGMIDEQQFAPEEVWTPTADSVGRLAILDWQAGFRADPWALKPFYLRPSAAEENAEDVGPAAR